MLLFPIWIVLFCLGRILQARARAGEGRPIQWPLSRTKKFIGESNLHIKDLDIKYFSCWPVSFTSQWTASRYNVLHPAEGKICYIEILLTPCNRRWAMMRVVQGIAVRLDLWAQISQGELFRRRRQANNFWDVFNKHAWSGQSLQNGITHMTMLLLPP